MTILPLIIASLLLAVPADSARVSRDSFCISGIVMHYQPGKSIHIALFANENDFEQERRFRSTRITAADLPPDSAHYVLRGVPRGEYVIAAFQDMNGDRKFNKGLFGRPTEPYCFYKPYTGLRAPKFTKCKFVVDRDIVDANLTFPSR